VPSKVNQEPHSKGCRLAKSILMLSPKIRHKRFKRQGGGRGVRANIHVFELYTSNCQHTQPQARMHTRTLPHIHLHTLTENRISDSHSPFIYHQSANLLCLLPKKSTQTVCKRPRMPSRTSESPASSPLLPCLVFSWRD